MINVLIADDNIEYAINLMNYINQKNENMQVASLNKDNIVMKMVTDLNYSIDITDKETRNNNIEYIIIGKVEKIGDSVNYNKAKDTYTQIMTTGTIKVDNVLKGELNHDEIRFQRLGGIISFAEYEKGLREEQKKKIGLCSRLNKIEKENSYVLYRPDGDIEIEEGKTYLMYLDYNSDYEGYSFRFMEYGLREVKYIGEEIYVLNNVTNEWENITEVI